MKSTHSDSDIKIVVTSGEVVDVTPATRTASRFVTFVTFVTLILNFYIRGRMKKNLKPQEKINFVYAYIGGIKTGKRHVTTSLGGEVQP